jgi:glutamine amidotransferase-like uncharacterized protein
MRYKYLLIPLCLAVFLFTIYFFTPILENKQKKTVYIYQDDGVSQTALLQTMQTLKTVLPPTWMIKTIDAKGVIANTWSKNAALFVMPGGADLAYVEKLENIGNQNIKSYVQNGGAYLGLCAGAYYAASRVEFDKNGPLAVVGHRALSFFEGKAIGPILAKYNYQTESSARAAKITLNFKDLKEATLYYNGGGYFEAAEQFKNTQVLGYYANHLPAIISVKYGKGQAILSGVHFEYDAHLLDPTDPFLAKIITQLKASDKKRLLLVRKILTPIIKSK